MSSVGSGIGENIRAGKAVEITQDELVDQNFARGYQAGYEAAKREVFERMKTWLCGKEDDPDGKDKDHEKAPG